MIIIIMNRFNSPVYQYLKNDISNISQTALIILRDLLLTTILNPQTGKINSDMFPSLYITNVHTTQDYITRDQLNPEIGDIVIVQLDLTLYIWDGINYILLNNEINSLSNMSDVQITTLTNNQYLVYDSVLQKFTNKSLILPSLSLNSLTDIFLNNISNNHILQFNSISQKFNNVNLLLSNCFDVNIISPNNTHVLRYNSTTQKWENIRMFLGNLGDILITNVTNKNILMYNSSVSRFVNVNLLLSNCDDILINSVQNKNILQYDSTLAKWKNIQNNITNLSDVVLSNIQNNQLLIYSNGLFINSNFNLNYFVDIKIISPLNGQILIYNNSKWENFTHNFITDTTYNTHINNNSIHRVLPDPQNNNYKKVVIYNNAYTLYDDSLNNLNNVNIISPQNNDVLAYNNINSMWENKQSQYVNKPIIDLLSSRDLVQNDNNKLLIYKSNAKIYLSINPNQYQVGTNFEIINLYETANLEIIPSNPLVKIYSNSQNFYCGRYTKLFCVDNNQWIFESNFKLQYLYRTIVTTTPNAYNINRTPPYNQVMSIDGNIKYAYIGFTNTTTNLRRYIVYDIENNTIIRETTPFLYQYGTNILNINNAFYFAFEYNNIGNLNFFKTMSFNTYSSVVVSTTARIVSKNFIWDATATRFKIAYVTNTNTVSVFNIRYDNLGIGNVTTTDMANVSDIIDIIMGYHFGRGIILMKTTSNTLLIKANGTTGIFDSDMAGTYTIPGIAIPNWYDQIQYITYSGTNNGFCFLATNSVFTYIDVYRMADTLDNVIKLLRFDFSTNISFSNGIFNNGNIYIPVNDYITNYNTIGSKLIKFNISDYIIEYNNNLFETEQENLSESPIMVLGQTLMGVAAISLNSLANNGNIKFMKVANIM